MNVTKVSGHNSKALTRNAANASAGQIELTPIGIFPVRLIRIGGRQVTVWLITNVVDEQQLPKKTASQFYRWRWRNEGLFRTYKRTLGKVKLLESHGSLGP